MQKTVRVPGFVRVGNAVVMTLTRLGVPLGAMALLTVRGRKSGQPRTTPVAVIEQDGDRYLIAAYGIVDWVRNLRASAFRRPPRADCAPSLRCHRRRSGTDRHLAR